MKIRSIKNLNYLDLIALQFCAKHPSNNNIP